MKLLSLAISTLLISQILFSQTSLSPLWQKPSTGYSLKFSQDARLIVTGGSTGNCSPFVCGQVEVWNVADANIKKIITPQPVMGFVNDLDITNNNTEVITANGSVYCAGDGGCSADRPGQYKFFISGAIKEKLTNNENIYAIQYSPDEAFIAAGTGYNNNGDIKIYDDKFNLLRTLPGHALSTTSLAFTPDGKYLVSGGNDGYIIVWDYKTGQMIRRLLHGSYFNGGLDINVDVSDDGKYISSAGQYYNVSVKVWRLSDGALINTFKIPDGNSLPVFQTAKFSPDGKYIVSGTKQYSSDAAIGNYGQLLVWDITAGKLVKKIMETDGSPSSGGIRSIAFSATNNLFAYTVNDHLKVFSTKQSVVAGTDQQSAITMAVNTTNASPNPFTTKTTISYKVTSPQHVNIAVYTSSGRLVATLVNEKKQPGNYQVDFNAGQYSKGLYLYKLQIGESVIARNILLQ